MKLALLNQAQFLDCCGSRKWARTMAEARPFETVDEMIKHADAIWRSLSSEDWLEAFSVHPKIGDEKAAPKQQARSAEWSRGEQSGMDKASREIRGKLAEANLLYEKKFGYIFIISAGGKSAEEMLQLCRERLKNDAETELQIAAEEQRKITEIRLKKLLEK